MPSEISGQEEALPLIPILFELVLSLKGILIKKVARISQSAFALDFGKYNSILVTLSSILLEISEKVEILMGSPSWKKLSGRKGEQN
jgi:hypothetical protein